MKLPPDFKKFGVRAEDFEVIAAEAMPSGSLKANPRKVTKEDVVEMLRKVC
jgi:alcohol dehydrogenase class IV